MGKPGSGKSTLLMNLIDFFKNKQLKIGGILTPEIRQDNIRKGFSIIDIFNNIKGTLSSVFIKSGPRVGKYRINLFDLNKIGVNAINFAIDNCDIIIIDEIGKMEIFFSKDFQKAVINALNSEKIVLASMGISIKHEFIDQIKSRNDINIFQITKENRNQILDFLKNSLASLIKK
ncbi:MAG: NTPase [Candidatus Helarchaeota archaeon]